MKKSAFISSIILLIIGCAKTPITNRNQLILVPESTLMSMSLTQYNQFLKDNPPAPATMEETKQVRRVGGRISHAVESYMKENGLEKRIKNYKWEFNYVQQNIVNAWCMPGGKVVVYEGIMPIAKDDEGLAVVMGHEIAHAVARHGNERMSQQLVAVAGAAGIAVYMKDKPKETQNIFLAAYGVGSAMGILAYSRQHESEADKMGMVFMAMAGYNPESAIGFWERMKAAGGANVPEFLSTHPSHDTRIERIKEYLPVAESYFKPAP